MKGFRNIFMGIMFLQLCLYSYAQPHTMLDSMSLAFRRYADSATTEFDRYSQKALEEYLDYSRKAAEEYGLYIGSIQEVWGKDNALDDTPSVWVEYSDDLTDRSIVDFESGKITVDVITDSEDGSTIERLLTAALVRMLSSRGSSCPYASAVDETAPLTERPVLEDMVDLSAYELELTVKEKASPPSPTVKGKRLDDRRGSSDMTQTGKTAARRHVDRQHEIKQLAEAIAKQSKKEIICDTSDGKSHRYVQITMSLAEDNLSKSAAIYKDIVKEFSATYNVEPALVFAVMEQESMFNPEATSWVPAYGLMQLVPESGGTDAYRYVYGKSWIPTRSYLFNPRNNIELGTAYLSMLQKQFSKIKDSDCRRLCVIASYNTGAGNVSRAFTGDTNISKAFKHINSYGFRQLYDFLTSELGSEEARNYVSGVSKRREKYLKQL